jgi:hypothetical protein
MKRRKMGDVMETAPRIVVHVRTIDGNIECCICRDCRRYTDPEIGTPYENFSWEYRLFKRQRRMRRKKRRGWA